MFFRRKTLTPDPALNNSQQTLNSNELPPSDSSTHDKSALTTNGSTHSRSNSNIPQASSNHGSPHTSPENLSPSNIMNEHAPSEKSAASLVFSESTFGHSQKKLEGETLSPPPLAVATPPQQPPQEQVRSPIVFSRSSAASRSSVRPDELCLPPIGIQGAEDPEFAEIPRLTKEDIIDPEVIAEKLNRLTELVQEVSVKSRDNNSILCQMLFMVEERMNRRIDQVKDELAQIIEKKFQVLQSELSSVPMLQAPPHPSSAPLPRSSMYKRPSMASRSTSGGGGGGGLTSIFESIDNNDVSSSMSRGTSLTIGGGGVITSSSSVVGGASSPVVQYENKTINPIPGFVIKTHKLIGDKEKVFINVFHHESIEVVPANLPKGTPENKPFLVMGNITRSLDANGRNTITHNIGVSSEYFKPDSPAAIEFKITAPASVQKVSFLTLRTTL
jgi:hypothetical protein